MKIINFINYPQSILSFIFFIFVANLNICLSQDLCDPEVITDISDTTSIVADPCGKAYQILNF